MLFGPALAAGSLSCTDGVSLGSWGTDAGTTGAGATGVGASGAGGSSASPGAGAGGASGALACNRVGTAGPRNAAGSEIGTTNTYTDWSWPVAPDSLELDFLLENELTDDGYFWAHGFGFAASSGGFVGLQYRGGYQADPPNGAVATTNMAVFWIAASPLRAELGDVPYPDARTYSRFDSGSQWWTIHALYAWQVCRVYRLRVGRQGVELNGDVWYGAWVRDTVTGVETFLGRILVPAAWGPLSTESNVWSSRIGYDPLTTCADIELASALFGVPSANQGSVAPSRRGNRFASPLKCGTSRFTDFDDAVRHEVGVPP